MTKNILKKANNDTKLGNYIKTSVYQKRLSFNIEEMFEKEII